MSFWRYWRDRFRESVVKARVIAEAVLFVLFLTGGLVLFKLPKFPMDKTIWWSVFLTFVVIFLVEICFVSPYRHVKSLQKSHTGEKAALLTQLAELEQKLQRQRTASVMKVIDEAVRLIREHRITFTLYALQQAGVGDLQTEEEFEQVREAIIQRNQLDPVTGLSLTKHEIRWLDLIKFANKKGIELSTPTAVYDCIVEWLGPRITQLP